MTDILASLYPWTKSLHVISVISWMAGLFYLPRLFVYHTEKVDSGGETHALFQMMEQLGMKYIPLLMLIFMIMKQDFFH